MTQYKVVYENARAQPGDTVYVKVMVYSSEDEGATWMQVPGGDTELGIPAETILTITQDEELTNAQKAGAINQLLLERIEDLGLTQSRDALAELEGLLPQGWPVTVNL